MRHYLLCVQDHIFKLMKNDSYSRYIRSDMYKEFLQGSKKKVVSIAICERLDREKQVCRYLLEFNSHCCTNETDFNATHKLTRPKADWSSRRWGVFLPRDAMLARY